jgi:hypothetical protein
MLIKTIIRIKPIDNSMDCRNGFKRLMPIYSEIKEKKKDANAATTLNIRRLFMLLPLLNSAWLLSRK